LNTSAKMPRRKWYANVVKVKDAFLAEDLAEPLLDAAEIQAPTKVDDLAKDIENLQDLPIIDQGNFI
jgi:hypothetical protein